MDKYSSMKITSDIPRYERMLFEHYTTYRTDFRDGDIKAEVRTAYKPKPGCLQTRAPPLKYLHTMEAWSPGEQPPPFDLLFQHKEILHTDPRKPQPRFERPVDTERAEAQRTRPRLVMTPAFSMDDIEDEGTRAVIVRAAYTSTVMQANDDTRHDYLSVRAPFSDTPAPADPIKLSPTQLPHVHPAWRRDMLAWDGRQLRTYVDLDREFWLRQPTTCKACVRTEERANKIKLAARC